MRRWTRRQETDLGCFVSRFRNCFLRRCCCQRSRPRPRPETRRNPPSTKNLRRLRLCSVEIQVPAVWKVLISNYYFCLSLVSNYTKMGRQEENTCLIMLAVLFSSHLIIRITLLMSQNLNTFPNCTLITYLVRITNIWKRSQIIIFVCHWSRSTHSLPPCWILKANHSLISTSPICRITAHTTVSSIISVQFNGAVFLVQINGTWKMDSVIVGLEPTTLFFCLKAQINIVFCQLLWNEVFTRGLSKVISDLLHIL